MRISDWGSDVFSADLKEVGQHGIRVNAVAPYATFAKSADAFSSGSRFHPDNAFFAKRAGTISDADRAMRQRRTLIGRPFAVPDEISGLVAYLQSARAAPVTGRSSEPREGKRCVGSCS